MAEATTTTKATTKKKTVKKAKTATRKTTKKAAKSVGATAAAQTEKSVESIFARIQEGFKEAGAALSESGTILDDKRREILTTLIENAQENTDATFDALREVMDADSVGESLRIQRDALRDGIERNVAQVRDVASLTAESGRETIEPFSAYFSTLRDRVSNRTDA